MADYKEKFEEWQQAAKDKFEVIDKQLGLKEKFGEIVLNVEEPYNFLTVTVKKENIIDFQGKFPT